MDTRYKLAGGFGLWLQVPAPEGTLWLRRYRFAGAEKNMTIGEHVVHAR